MPDFAVKCNFCRKQLKLSDLKKKKGAYRGRIPNYDYFCPKCGALLASSADVIQHRLKK
jgi:hypothetical protein